jgi:hypothetical protein
LKRKQRLHSVILSSGLYCPIGPVSSRIASFWEVWCGKEKKEKEKEEVLQEIQKKRWETMSQVP